MILAHLRYEPAIQQQENCLTCYCKLFQWRSKTIRSNFERYLTKRLLSLSPAEEVARHDAPLLLALSLVLLAAARAPPLLLHLGVLIVVDEELGLGWE